MQLSVRDQIVRHHHRVVLIGESRSKAKEVIGSFQACTIVFAFCFILLITQYISYIMYVHIYI